MAKPTYRIVIKTAVSSASFYGIPRAEPRPKEWDRASKAVHTAMTESFIVAKAREGGDEAVKAMEAGGPPSSPPPPPTLTAASPHIQSPCLENSNPPDDDNGEEGGNIHPYLSIRITLVNGITESEYGGEYCINVF